MGNCTSTSEKEKSSLKPESRKQVKPNMTTDESTKSSSYKNNGSKTFRKQELAESTIMSTFTADNMMKEKEYSKYMEKVKDFNPRVRRVDSLATQARDTGLHRLKDEQHERRIRSFLRRDCARMHETDS